MSWIRADEPSLLLAGTGALLLALAWGWRWWIRHRSVVLLRARLGDADPTKRAEIIREVTVNGIGSYARELLEHARRERDTQVLDILLLIVAANQWEPGDQPAVRDLRALAAAHLQQRLPPSEWVRDR